ncbi:guanine nucleotide-binding protein-like protein alpha-3 subunit [Aaosphaeria arxii CBS 175.79]|uniref:Guanine nucleotide-binding protein-like protein alpha-3 subunit n=1 Tax=Aaosphaeria arxii CBS 175.79 TaxID=1450172 RepID=A0A6A5Y818_9PLEO|nr:guanine nucleotide-binding protein-like protein alpha-3 subunit [Aaosphaeria arxii CBS 175.79]KAF2020704.1 guanine nucleotide-binding protein-like protein alpha-3 subunit [Aaosphaeria arxii CBS 175.79]
MADEKSVYALTSAVATNMDRLRASINELRQLHDRWKDENGTSINLIAQITSLKTNLGEMQDWMNYSINEMHPQLLQDLDVLMNSCGILVRHLEALMATLKQPAHDNVDWALKLRYSVSTRSMERLRNAAKRQADAVALLLAACKCHTTAQRKILLHKSRQIRKEDASSMSTLARTSKLNSQCIKTLTSISSMIQWFRFLFFVKITGKEEKPPPTEEDYLDAAAAMRSEAIDRSLEEDAASLRRETKLVLMGSVNSGKELIMRQMKVLYADGYPREERMGYRYAVRSTIRLLIHAMIDLLRDTGISLPKELHRNFAVLLDEVENTDIGTITPDAVRAVTRIWNSNEFSTLYVKNFEIDFPQYTPYFAQDIERIADVDYIPSEADIIRLNHSMGGIKELRFTWDDMSVHLFNISGYIPDQFRKRWFHQLEGASALIFTVDISTYDRPYLGQSAESQLLSDFATFESWANSPKFFGASIVLLLNNFTRFREKLQHSPMQTFFEDYTPDDEDPETAARQYILKRFKELNRNRLSMYSFWVDLDMSDNQHLYAALKKTLSHIQTRKARSEVWEANSQGLKSRSTLSRSARNSGGLASPSSPRRSNTVTTRNSSTRG